MIGAQTAVFFKFYCIWPTLQHVNDMSTTFSTKKNSKQNKSANEAVHN